MRATVIHGERDVRVEEVPDPVIRSGPEATGRDAIVRVVAACVCGSDLWRYRGVVPTGRPQRIGHELVGVVEAVGAAVEKIRVGDFVIAPFSISDGTCVNCRNGMTTACVHAGFYGNELPGEGFADGAQGERVRVPLADGTLFVVPGGVPDDALVPHLLALSDVMATGHHAAVAAGVTAGSTVAVVGDGAVGLCAVIAAKRLGAVRIVAMSRHEDRQRLARELGATDVVPERGAAGVARLKEMFDGVGPDAVLECVGTKESMDQAVSAARPGGRVGFVGVPNGGPELPVRQLFATNVTVGGGMAPVRAYLDELVPEALDGTIQPGKVFDLELPLAEIAEAYRAMDERRAIKVLVRP